MIFKASIETIEGEMAVVRLPDGQSFRVPMTSILGTPSIGSEVSLLLSTGIADQEATQELARALLNQMIKPTE